MNEQSNRSSADPRRTINLELMPNGYTLRKICNDRFPPADSPKNITLSLGNYIPLDQINTETYIGTNMLGGQLNDPTIRSGSIYPSFDGKRLVLEVGCNTVIYLQISAARKDIHHNFFIQKHKDFLMDITTRLVASKVYRATQPVVTIAKYEIYFLMGLFSTVSIPLWLTITGTDVSLALASIRQKEKKFNGLASVVLAEMKAIEGYAPTLHSKMLQIFKSEQSRVVDTTWDRLPRDVITDEKAQAQTAGILYGKYAMVANPITVWNALFTVLIQAALKSATNLPTTFLDVLDDRYKAPVKALANTNWGDLNERKRAVVHLVNMMKDSGVTINAMEMEKIIDEVRRNPDKLQQSFHNLLNAYKTFRRDMH